MSDVTSAPDRPDQPSLREAGCRADVRDLLTRCSFPPQGTSVTCAVSGGADSCALAVLAHAHGLSITLVHVDHGLRAGSAAEADTVAALARRLQVPFRAEQVTVADGPNLEARARDARYGVLPADVVTGHTADDQAETMLINLLRGAGLPGLAAMRPSAQRPLLGVRRSETRQLCNDLAIDTVDDPSNADPRFLRNRVRHELLPLLDDIAQRDLVAVLVRQTALLRDDNELLDALAADLDPTDARALADAPAPLARRAIRRWLGGTHAPDAATVERVLAVARGSARACEIGDGRSVRRTAQRLRIEPGTPSTAGPGTNSPRSGSPGDRRVQ